MSATVIFTNNRRTDSQRPATFGCQPRSNRLQYILIRLFNEGKRMATDQHFSHSGGDAAILARLIRPRNHDLPAPAAKAFLNIRIEGDELARLQDLLARNQDDDLGPADKSDLESYLRVSAFLDLMRAKARRSLKKHR
jgi:hypothetical protein